MAAMSLRATPITDDHVRYLAARTVAEDEFLRRLRAAAEAEGLPAISIAPEQGSFIHLLLRLARAREVVEVGTLGGYSAIWMARALPPDGRVRTIEVNPRHADFAERWIAQSDVAGRVEVLPGPGRTILPTLGPAGACDAVLLDADKESYPVYLAEASRLLRPGGLLLADNAFAFGDLFTAAPERPDVAAIRAFNDLLAADPRYQSIIVPLGDGLWVAVKR